MEMNPFERLTQQQFRSWARVYDWPCTRRLFFERAYQGTWKLAQTILTTPTQSPRTVLDVACGTGTILEELARQFPQYQFLGIDFSPEMLARAQAKRQTLQNLDVKLAAATSLPIATSQIDLVLCTDSFHHFDEPDQALAEIARVLRPGGRLILVEPAVETLVQRLIMLGFVGRFLETPKQFYQRDDLVVRLARVGLKVDEWTTRGLSHFVVAQKINLENQL